MWSQSIIIKNTYVVWSIQTIDWKLNLQILCSRRPVSHLLSLDLYPEIQCIEYIYFGNNTNQ